jgi:hypothetical protein
VDLRSSRDAVRSLSRPVVGGIEVFARSLSTAPHRAGGLFAVGTSTFEPWHLVAHLRDAAQWSGQRALVPVLVRHSVPAGAPAHLSIGVERLARAGRGETILVVAPDDADEYLLERLTDAQRHGSTVLALSAGSGGTELEALANDSTHVRLAELEPAQHLLPLSAAGLLPATRTWRERLLSAGR